MLSREWTLFLANYFVTAPQNDRRADVVCQGFMLRTRTRFTSKQPHIFPQEQWQSRCVLLSPCQLIQNDLIKMCAHLRATLADKQISKWQICQCFALSYIFSPTTAPLPHFGGSLRCIIYASCSDLVLFFVLFFQTNKTTSNCQWGFLERLRGRELKQMTSNL